MACKNNVDTQIPTGKNRGNTGSQGSVLIIPED